ncbi:MAG: hypothetical protein KAT35_02650, partial [Candidatus Aenigmarchaeota archaeon]|nr:hypothetical protein [Candidatus Aenigmarchaeota archaeon]
MSDKESRNRGRNAGSFITSMIPDNALFKATVLGLAGASVYVAFPRHEASHSKYGVDDISKDPVMMKMVGSMHPAARENIEEKINEIKIRAELERNKIEAETASTENNLEPDINSSDYVGKKL